MSQTHSDAWSGALGEFRILCSKSSLLESESSAALSLQFMLITAKKRTIQTTDLEETSLACDDLCAYKNIGAPV